MMNVNLKTSTLDTSNIGVQTCAKAKQGNEFQRDIKRCENNRNFHLHIVSVIKKSK